MKFQEVCSFVQENLNKMSLYEKIKLFKEIFKYPIDYKDGVFFYKNQESTETILKDFLHITERWMSVVQFDILYKHFEKNNNDV